MLSQNLFKGKLGGGPLPGVSEPFAFQTCVATSVPQIIFDALDDSLWRVSLTRLYNSLCLLARLSTNKQRTFGH